MMLSAYLIVESRCAITIVVIDPSSDLILSIAAYTSFSFFLSKALVASSKSRTLGFFTKALAIAILYFCPPESYPPELPTFVLIPSAPSF